MAIKASTGGSHYLRRPTTTLWGWLLALSPLALLVLAGETLLQFDAVTSGRSHMGDAAVRDLAGGRLVGTGLLLVSLILAAVPLAIADRRVLRRGGIVRPFHWAYSMIPVVYLIGRAIVVFRHQGSGSLLVAVYLMTGVLAGATIGLEAFIALFVYSLTFL